MSLKRKTKRIWRKELKAFLASVSILGILYLLLNNIIGAVFSPKLELLLGPDFAKLTLHVFFLFVLVLISVLFSTVYLELNSPDQRFFSAVDFGKPTDAILRDAVKGILKSEKTQPYFVHVAPVNEEIAQFNYLLDAQGFVMVNGKPGQGKTMLAYNTCFRYRRKTRYFPITFFKYACRVYALNLEQIKDKTDIPLILAELDSLKGGKNKIILVDDAHKLEVEEQLQYEFRKEAYEGINGKFVWVNTNYLEAKKIDVPDSIQIEFERFYLTLIQELYQSYNPIISEEVRLLCTNLEEAVELSRQGKIKDAWHFNFVATNGELRISETLNKISEDIEKQDLLLFILFFHSTWNIITGEKEITQTGLSELLGKIDIVPFKENIKKYSLDNLLSELASQDKGRFLIIKDKDSINRGFLHALHYRMSIAIVKTITSYIQDEGLIHKLLNAQSYLLTSDYVNTRYIGVLFTALGEYKKYFLQKNIEWIHEFFDNILTEQLHVYPWLLRAIKQYDKTAYQEIVDKNIYSIALNISKAKAERFKAIHEFIQVLGAEKNELIYLLNFEQLAKTTNEADVTQFHQIGEFLRALGDKKAELLDRLNFEQLAKTTNGADVTQFHQIGGFLRALGDKKAELLDRLNFEQLAKTANGTDVAHLAQLEGILNGLGDKKTELIDKLNFEQLAKTASGAEVTQIHQIGDFLRALGDKKAELLDRLNFEQLAKTANGTEVAQFHQIGDFLRALGDKKTELIDRLNFEQLAKTANGTDAAHLAQLEGILNGLGGKKTKLIDRLNFEQLAKTASGAEVAQFHQIGDFLRALGDKKTEFIDRLNFEQLAKTANGTRIGQFAQLEGFLNSLEDERVKLTTLLNLEQLADTANKAGIVQIYQIADFINSLGDEKKHEFSSFLDSNVFISLSRMISGQQISPFCIIVASFDEKNQQELINAVDWLGLLKTITINHSELIKAIVYVLTYYSRKTNKSDENEQNEIEEYLTKNDAVIIYYSTRYLFLPEDYSVTVGLLTVLCSLHPVLAHKIVYKLSNKLVDKFEISPKYYQYLADLLNVIRLIDAVICQKFINNVSVRKKIGQSLIEAQFDEQITGQPNLLMTIKEIDPVFYQELQVLQYRKDAEQV